MVDFQWFKELEQASKTCIDENGMRIVHYTMKDKTELVEEYDIRTKLLKMRKWKRKSMTGGDLGWEYEVGAPPANLNATEFTMKEDLSNVCLLFRARRLLLQPIFLRLDTADEFQWKVRNISYSLDVYSLKVEKNEIVLRTANKKYYKRFNLPDLSRLGLVIEEDKFALSQSGNTLVIKVKLFDNCVTFLRQYAKPAQYRTFEKKLMTVLTALKPMNTDSNCNPC